MSFREDLHKNLNEAHTTTARIIDAVLVALILIVCLIFVVGTYPLSEDILNTLNTIEIIIIFIFIIEYIARLYAAPNRFKQIFNIYSIIDLIAILPVLILFVSPSLSFGWLRILRLFRVFRFLRFTSDPNFFFGTITWHLLKVIRLIMTILMIFFIASGLFWFAESPYNEGVKTFADAFYFTVIALTTVGFGDITPITDTGKWVTVLSIISGIVLIPWQVSQIAKEWIILSGKHDVVCKKCGLRYHDKDATHCKACGNLIYQEEDRLT